MPGHSTSAWVLASALGLGCATLAACGDGAADVCASESQSGPDRASVATAPAAPRSADSRPLNSLTSRQARSAAQWPGQRYVTRDQLAHEELVAGPYTLVVDADGEAAVETGFQLADTVHTYAGGKSTFSVFVRSPDPALAARLAERLRLEQGWANVFVVL